MKNKKLKLTQNYPLESILFFFFILLPISFLLGNFAINFLIININLILLVGFLTKKFEYFLINKNIFYLLLFLFFSYFLNLIFSNNFFLTFPRVAKFILIIGLILSFKQIQISYTQKQINNIFKFWSFIFIIVVIDIIFELIFKKNILGFSSIMPGRVASFAGTELNIGHYFSAFSLLFLSYFFSKQKNFSLNLLISILLISLSFLIGERSNFIKTLLIVTIFVFFVYEIKLHIKLLSLTAITAIIILILNINPNYKLRYVDQFTNVIFKSGINYYFNNTVYGAHYNVAKEIFKDNPFFGAGIKNFRIESVDKKYDNLNHSVNDYRANTHPHQIHYELLAETGIIGYLSFAIFIIFSIYLGIKNYLRNKNFYQLSGILYVVISLLPILPTGSFFSTYSSSIFWVNYAIMVGYINNNSK